MRLAGRSRISSGAGRLAELKGGTNHELGRKCECRLRLGWSSLIALIAAS